MNAATLQSLHPTYASVFDAVPEPAASGSYGDRRGPNWIAIALIAALHVLLLGALVMFDVIPVKRAERAPLVMTLIPEEAPPPEAPPPPPEAAPDTPPPAAVVVPTPIVKVAAAAPAVTVTEVAPPVTPVASAAPAEPSVVSAVAAPITPPSANAATLNNPAPRYPVEARRKRQEGTVRLRVVITVQGRVKDISVARSSGFASLDEAALDAVRRWKFVPGMQAGEAVEAVGFVPIPFRLT